MSQSIRTYDPWERDHYRLLVGFGFLGFGLLFWWGMAHEPDAHSAGWGWVYVIVAMAVIPGLLIIMLKQLVLVDPQRHRVTRVMLLAGIAVSRRSWLFSELRCVRV